MSGDAFSDPVEDIVVMDRLYRSYGHINIVVIDIDHRSYGHINQW
jgi:hypothetical protein